MPRSLAGCPGWGCAVGVEFFEPGLVDARETLSHAGEVNRQDLHGTSILSCDRIYDDGMLLQESGGDWTVDAPKDDGQVRVEGRIALAAQLATEREPVRNAVVHHDRESERTGRARQTRRLFERPANEFGSASCIVGGALNANGFLLAGPVGFATLDGAAGREPGFAHFAAEDFDWRRSSASEHATGLYPEDQPGSPLTMLDRLPERGVLSGRPVAGPARGANGECLSGREMVGAAVWP